MAHFIKFHWCNVVLIASLALGTLSSCINDGLTDCPSPSPSPAHKKQVSLSFKYDYNIKEADAFTAEVKNVNVYVFDEYGKFYDTYVETSEKFSKDYKMDISDLRDGKYSFVCLARNRSLTSRADDEDEMEFSFTTLTPGVSTINDLTEKMGKEVNDKNFAALYTTRNIKQIEIKSNEKEVEDTIDLMKCTKNYRIVLLPYNNDQPDFTPENFDVRINGSAGYLDHEGKKVQNEAITYLPYSQRLATNGGDQTEVEGKPIDKALVYDLSSSRMFERKDDSSKNYASQNKEFDDKRIVITDKRINKVIFDHSLPWFLALCGEHDDKVWGDQEYLDRQDHYTLTFYVPDGRDYSLDAEFKVNGWVMNIQDGELKSKKYVGTTNIEEDK